MKSTALFTLALLSKTSHVSAQTCSCDADAIISQGVDSSDALVTGAVKMGTISTASGYASTAMGYGTQASGYASTAMGYQTTANVNYATAMGQETTASGTASTAMGQETTASSFSSTAMGYQTTASGYYSTAMGLKTTASGMGSTSMGYNTTASFSSATAMGFQSKASGMGSTSMGYGTQAGFFQLVIGINNVVNTVDNPSLSDYNNDKTSLPAFTIGNGNFPTEGNIETRSNAFQVMYNGDTTIAGALKIGNTVIDETTLQQLLDLLNSINSTDENKRECLKMHYNTLSGC